MATIAIKSVFNPVYLRNKNAFKQQRKTLKVMCSHNVSSFKAFNDTNSNNKLYALATGQMLCSVGTLIHDSYLPLYMRDVLGLSNMKIGAVQGIAQFLCQFTKGVSGIAGDVLGSQERVLMFGSLLTLLCKPMFAMLSNVYFMFGASTAMYWFFVAKLMDRMSKGIRETPSKAIINELAHKAGEPAHTAYGIRHSLATMGVLIGSTISAGVFIASGKNYTLTFTIATIPPLLAFIWMFIAFKDEIMKTKRVSETKISKSSTETSVNLLKKMMIVVKEFKSAYWQALAVVSALYFARFDASFLSLRAKHVMPTEYIPMLFFASAVIQTVVTAPIAKLSTKSVSMRNIILYGGFAMMILANAMFGLSNHICGMFLGAIFLGFHMAMTHSLTMSMMASYMPVGEIEGVGKLTGTAVSLTDLILGFILAMSNVNAGYLCDISQGSTGCFAGGALATTISAILLMIFSKFGSLK
jgi:Na+/melibiose symporter-like transporter